MDQRVFLAIKKKKKRKKKVAIRYFAIIDTIILVTVFRFMNCAITSAIGTLVV